MKKFLLIIFFCFAICHYQQLSAQETTPQVSTDRPSVSFSAGIVPKNSLTLEVGYFYSQDDFAGINNRYETLPNLLLRYGVSDNFELRLGVDNARSRQDFGLSNAEQNGVVPLVISSKINILEASGIIPKLSLIGNLSLPGLASEAFRADFVAAGFRFAAEHSLSERIGLFYNFGGDFGQAPDNSPQFTGALSGGLSASFGRLGVFVEAFGFLPDKSVDYYGADVGLVLNIADRFQLDGSFGIALTEYAPDTFFNLGGAVLIGK